MLFTIIKRSYRYIKVKNATKHATKMAEVQNKKMYVIQIFKKIRVYDRERINALINAGVLSKKLRDAMILDKACIFVANPPKK